MSIYSILPCIAFLCIAVPKSALGYLLDTGGPAGPDTFVAYGLDNDLPLFAVEFTNSVQWNIGSIEGYFTTLGLTSSLIAKIWEDGGNIPDTEKIVFQSNPTEINVGEWEWLGVDNLDWTLSPGTWWVGFTYSSGAPAYWYGDSVQSPDDPVWEVQYSTKYGWYIADNAYDFTLRIDETGSSPVPEPATFLLFSIGIAGFAGSRMKKRK